MATPSAAGKYSAQPSQSHSDRALINLPMPRSPLIGRDSELATLRAMLQRDDISHITLTGTGGSGKTHLALHLATRVSQEFPGV